MAYQPCCCSVTLLCLVCISVFYTPLALSVLLPFMLYAPCPFIAQFFFCSFQLLHSDPSSCMNHLQQQHPHQLQQQEQPHLFSILCIYRFCAPCACNAHNTSAYSYHVNILHNSSALSDHHHDSSTSLVVFPLVQHHCMLC